MPMRSIQEQALLRWLPSSYGLGPEETASHKPLLEDAEEYIGPTMVLADNEEYCAFARFAMPTVEFGIWYKRPNPKKNVT